MSEILKRLNSALEGRYRIESELGEGGMATVYLADDLKHERKVALKVLKPELAAVMGAERFLAEIRLTANLQHPHILPLFDSGEADGFLFYVMPYVEGETLRGRMDREKQLPIEEAASLCVAVAGALDYAHRQGVVHRDVKPANILLHDGQPLVADFGIALAVQHAGGGRLTETGLSLGTPHYMSPEQATADRDPDARSDVYSLACVLYELLTGEPTFPGNSAQAVLSKIITTEPVSPSEHRRSIPAWLDAVILKALEKLPADRFTTAAEFANALQNPAVGETLVLQVPTDTARRSSWLIPLLAAAMALLAAVAFWGWVRPGPDDHVHRFVVGVPSDRPLRDLEYAVDMVPDGSALVYAGTMDGTSGLFYRPMDMLESTFISGTEGGYNPAVSPDGESVAFITGPGGGDQSLLTVPLSGGPPFELSDSLVDEGGVSWGDDGFIYYDAASGADGLARIPEAGGRPEVMTIPDTAAGELWHFQPEALPGARGVLFTIARGDIITAREFQIAVGRSPGDRHQVLVEDAHSPLYASDGSLLFVRQGQLMAAPFNLGNLEVVGDPVPVATKVAERSLGRSHISISQNGTLIYASGQATGIHAQLVWMDRDGNVDWLNQRFSGIYRGFALSPDGNSAAIVSLNRAGNSADILVADLADGGVRTLTFSEAGEQASNPVWTPDGQEIVFTLRSPVEGESGLYRGPADGRTLPGLFLASPNTPEGVLRAAAFSADGQWMIYARGAGDHKMTFALRLDSDSPEIPLHLGGRTDGPAAVSPDGQWIAYSSAETGTQQVYVRPFPNTESGKWMVSKTGGGHPRWSPDGSELFFLTFENELMAAGIVSGPAFQTTEPTRLFSREMLEGGRSSGFAVSPDGQRFLNFSWAGSGAGSQTLAVVENFLREVREKVNR